jgi:hypothetical protein
MFRKVYRPRIATGPLHMGRVRTEQARIIAQQESILAALVPYDNEVAQAMRARAQLRLTIAQDILNRNQGT